MRELHITSDVCDLVMLRLPRRPLLQQHMAALLAGERPVLTALLEALWVWDTGATGPWLRWANMQQQWRQQQHLHQQRQRWQQHLHPQWQW